MTWTRHKSGAGWRILDDGRIVLEHGVNDASIGFRQVLRLDADSAVRTRGEPVTARTLIDEYGPCIEAAAMVFGLPASWVAAMVTIEAVKIAGTPSFDPISIRDEDYAAKKISRELERYRDRPHRVSAGLMQTLLSTARLMQARHPIPGLLYGAGGTLDLSDLCVPERSLYWGGAYMRYQADRFGADPVLLVGAYNAGGLYETTANPWRLRTYGRDRIAKFAAYHNDILEVLKCP